VQKTVVLNVVGLTSELIGAQTPNLREFRDDGALATVEEALPAVTCTAQTNYLTGREPSEHGIVGNGWYFRDRCEVKFWRQSNHLVQSPKIWEVAREVDDDFTCGNLFWWYNMYSTVDYSVTPRPMYPADGRKIPDLYTKPRDLRFDLQEQFGQFPLFKFWGPDSSIEGSEWIVDAAKFFERRHAPTLTLIYLPHLDYDLQKVGVGRRKNADALREIDEQVGELIDFYESRGAEVAIVSEYGLEDVDRPVHLNRRLRREGFVEVREELDRELLDPGASPAFAVADHQIAHVYVDDDSQRPRVRDILESTPGVAEVLGEEGKRERGLDHPRSGAYVCVADEGAWFTYYYWLDDDRAPDFARTVDIHRKPGYDPVELFVDPELTFPKLQIAKNLVEKKLGFRYMMDVIPLDATLVGGSHGRRLSDRERKPVAMVREGSLLPDDHIRSTDVFGVLLRRLGVDPADVGRAA